ncbi:FAD/NAD(P)-binding domain-containing protein [Mycena pura]|uniref:FAD/NAD(P)-binding domain-containing protein n=1 Tax=Mycena pura TaxID=153505 RepID=A0AAD6USG4_9AGAR|nr:FAD/NAD(P)-binding domain-containing protein [Mycena pura]
MRDDDSDVPLTGARDVLAPTWDLRSLHGAAAIRTSLVERLAAGGVANIAIAPRAPPPALQRPAPDIAWISAMPVFDFETRVGLCSRIVRLVPASDAGVWKAHCVYTNLEGLKGHPERIGALRNPSPNHGKWASERAASLAFEDADPVVLYLGVCTLVVEKNAIGDNWRNRYEALCLHDPVRAFPPTWPVYTPAHKLANWLEHYAEALELDVWTRSKVQNAQKNRSGAWDVTVDRRAGASRVLRVRHLIFATGSTFEGQMLHSAWHKLRAADHEGKKVVVIGTGTSAHDIAADYCEHGVGAHHHVVHCFLISRPRQRGSTYGGPATDVADRMNPRFMAIELYRRIVKVVAFKLNLGVMDAGVVISTWHRGGGYYTGVCPCVAGTLGRVHFSRVTARLRRFIETGLKFEDGSELSADAVVCATAYRVRHATLGDMRSIVRKVCGDAVADACKRLFGLDAEGKVHLALRELGLFSQLCRGFNGQAEIKAMVEGLFGERYCAEA